jgi:hypothetical protein
MNFCASSLSLPTAPSFYRATAVATFVTGAGLHGLRILIGAERLVATYFTPVVDGAFGLLMLVSAIAGWLSFRRFTGGRAYWVGFIVGLMMITVSIPIHLGAFAMGSTQYVVSFPVLFSLLEIPLFLTLAYVVTRLRFRQ